MLTARVPDFCRRLLHYTLATLFVRGSLSATMRRGGFGRSVAIMAGGAAAAQAVNVLVSPALTRLYLPAELGQLALYLAFLYVASMVLSLRYEQAVVTAVDDGQAHQLAVLSLAMVPVTSLLAALSLFLLIVGQIGGFGSLPPAAAVWGFFALVLFGTFGVLRYVLVRTHRHRVIAQVGIAQSVVRAALQVGLGYLGASVTGLLAGDLVGRAIGIGRMAKDIGGDVWRNARNFHAIPGRALLGQYRKFPLFGVPSSVINALALTLPVPLIAGLYGLEAAGYFSLVQRVLSLPIAVVGASAADALHGRIAEYARLSPARARPLFTRAAVVLLGIGLAVAVAIVLFGPRIFGFVFGDEWRRAGELAQVMAPWFVAALTVSPLSRVVLVYQGQKLKLLYDLSALGAVLASLLIGASVGLDLRSVILVLSILQALVYAFYFTLLRRLIVLASE